MANINKSFNFRNGVQVDDDNFIVNANGLVGIGTSIPREILDVHGTAKITGLVTATNLAVSGVSTFYNDVKVGSAITAVASTGVVYATQFVGSASGLTGIVAISTNGWIVNAGTLSTASKVGIGTSFPYYSLQVGNDPLTGNGFSVDALSGNVNTTGILTASNLKTIGSITGYNFSGFGTDITGINATNISNGTLNNSRLPSSINLTGIITGYSLSGFGTDITGINATNISNGTLNNSRLPTNLNISGIITANSGVVTSLTAGIASITQLYVSGVTTSLQGFVGNIVGIASTALSLSGSPSITVTNINSTGIITSSNIISGIITASTRLYAESVGVGTISPSADIHIHRNSISKLQVTSDTAESIIAVGRSTILTGSNGALRFGNTSANTPYSTPKSLDIINYDSGNLNFYIQLGSPIQTGTFNWFRGQTAPTSPIMTLTYAGYLGIGITLPQHNIHVSGSSTVTDNSYVGQNFYVAQNAYITGSVTANGFNGNATTATTATTATNAQGLTGTPNLNVGIVTATSFVGNGSGLTGIIASGSGIVVKDSGTTVGTAGTIDFGDNLTVSAISAGIVTVTGSASGGGGSSQFVTTAAGIHTLSNVGIGTTNPTSALTVSGDVKVTGIITASSFSGNASSATYATSAGIATYSSNSGIATYATSAGISTYSSNSGIATYATSAGIATYATSAGISTYSSNSGIATYATNAGVATYATSSGISTYASNAGIATYSSNSGIATYATSAGIATTAQGLTGTPNLNVGVVTATSFVGNGSGLTGIVGGISGIVIKDSGSTVGTAGTIDFGDNLTVSTISAGIVTVTGSTGNAGIATYASNAGIATYASNAGIATYASNAGIATYASNAGIATYASNAGIATYASNAGIATYASNAGIATYASNAGIATYASNAGIATYASNAGIATYTSEWILGANGSSDYTFTGPGFTGAENDPVLYLVRGQQYKFTNTMGMHPFRIQSTVNGSTGSQYNDGITNNDVSNGTLTWNVQFDAPNILYYQCTAHGGMGGKIYIIDAGIATYASNAGIATFATSAGIATYASNAGIATFATSAGIATYASNAGIATYSSNAGIATNAQGLTGTPNLNVGIVTATLFVGNGSGLTNLIGVGAGIVVKDSGTVVGTAGTIDFGDNLTVSAISAGIVTVTGSASGGSSQWVTTAAGIHTLSNVGIGTTNPTSALTVKGNTSLETLNVTGVSTFGGNINVSEKNILFGLSAGSSDDRIVWGASSAEIYTNTTNLFLKTNLTSLNLQGEIISLLNYAGDEVLITASNGGSVDLYYNNSKKLETTGIGITVTGTIFTNQLNVSGIASVGTGITMYGSTGIISATTFYGNVVGNISGSITDATNLTGGYANASQLNVSGVTTISQGRIQADASSNLRFGNIAAGSGSGRNIAIGDQVLYSLSGGQGRNIGIGELSYYDTTSGQYNIGLGIQAGQKITTGNYNVILGGYDGQTGLDIRTSSNNVVIADGQGNIRQYINSSGNVGIKTTVITEALTVAGIVSATSFYGTLNAGQLTGTLPAINGSALIGVIASGTGIIIEEDGTPVGTAGTINFGSNINVTFASGIATVYVPSVPYASVAGVATVATNAQGLTGTPSITVTNVNANRFILPDCGNLINTDNTEKLTFGTTPDFKIYHLNQSPFDEENRIEVKTHPLRIGTIEEISAGSFYHTNLISVIPSTTSAKVELGFGTSFPNTKLTTTGYGVSIYGGINAPTGIITASSFSGSGSGLTNLPAAQLTGTLPAIDGSALLNVTAAGTGIAIRDDNASVGSATTVNFGTGLDVTFSSGIATITASGGSLQSRTTVSGVTTSIANLGIGNTNITGFKSYALMKVGLSTTGWLRLYTDNTSRANDASRSVGEDPAPGSGVIAEVVTTGISTTQIISPFVMGGNLDNSPTTTIYASIKNLSGSTQTITANLTILQLEA